MSKTFYLFDIDGTLTYSEGRDSRSFAESYQAIFDRPFPTLDWSKFTDVTDHVIFREAFHDHFDRYPTEEEREVFEAHYTGALAQVRCEDGGAYRAVPGAVAYWRRLEADPHAVVGIATGGWQRPQSLKLHHVGLPAATPYAGYANDRFSRVDILQTAIDLARDVHTIDKIVYFGDALWDLNTTRRMNLPFVGVRWRGDHHKLTDHGHQHVVTDFTNMELVDEMVTRLIK